MREIAVVTTSRADYAQAQARRTLALPFCNRMTDAQAEEVGATLVNPIGSLE